VKLYVAGLGLHGDGYPNASRTVALLRECADLEVVDCGGWLPESLHLWKLAQMPRWQALRWLLVLVFGNLRSLLRVLVRIRAARGLVYVPYPGVFFLFWVSLLPRGWRPVCIVDSYISIWDSAFRDRSVAQLRSLVARIVKWFEARALRAAAMVLVDTDVNRDVFMAEFGLEADKVRSLPLAIDEGRFIAVAESPVKRSVTPIRVLFVGTLIPLHGIDVMLDGLARLADDARFEFRLLGDGQQAKLVADFMAAHPSARITWVRKWCTLDEIATEIAAADICLGVFGGECKAARVLPFKLYMYLAAGRAIVSQSLLSTPQGIPFPPIEVLAQYQGVDLAAAIQRIADHPARREHMQREAAAYYRRWLSNVRVMDAWREVLAQLQLL
jgi:glycosyltransferase involved in cell wall biosynthesis